LSTNAPLPPGWIWTTLGEITGAIDKVDPSSRPEDSFVYLDISSIDNALHRVTEPKQYLGKDAPSRARQKVRARDTLFSTVRTYLRNVAQVPDAYEGQVASTGFSVLRPSVAVQHRYLFYYMLTDDLHKVLADLQRGTSYPAVRDSDVREHSIPLAPLAEQQRIVDAIETQFTRLDAAEAALRRVQAALKRYRAAVLKAACEGSLVPTEAELARAEGRPYEPAATLLARILDERRARWQAENPRKPWKEPAAPDTDNLPELPEGWCWARIDQVADVLGGLTKNGRRNSLPLNFPYLRVANVYADRLQLDDISYINVNPSEIERVLLHKDDLLVVEGNGSGDQIGRVAIWDGSIDPCLHQNHIIKVRFQPREMARFVLYWLLSQGGREQITLVASSTSGLYTLNLSKVANLTVPVPPLAEQHRICAEIERIGTLGRACEQATNDSGHRAVRLRQSILQRAFTGQLVPQNPSDEPAAVLLERIRDQRTAAQSAQERLL
jgi:type I restriction enzyme S subunit